MLTARKVAFAIVLTINCFSLILPLQAEYPYCFSFTWLGPYAKKENIIQESCDNRVGIYPDIPCQKPLLVTDNDKVPDTYTLWQNSTYLTYACPMEPGWSCVKYSYIFKGGVQNITYMCAKVNATNGCYQQTHLSGMEVEACVCTSKVGLIPCNAAYQMKSLQLNAIFLGLVITILCNYYKII